MDIINANIMGKACLGKHGETVTAYLSYPEAVREEIGDDEMAEQNKGMLYIEDIK